MHVAINDSKFIRDLSSKAMLADDITELRNYKNRKVLLRKQEEDINNLKEEVSELRPMIVDLTEMVQKLLTKQCQV